MRRGFLMALEAAASLFLLVIAASAIPIFHLQKTSAHDFFLCSDAAVILSKTNAFSDGSLQEKLDKAASLSGLCIGASSAAAFASSCEGNGAGEKFSFALPVWQDGAVENATVSCWRGR